MSKPFWFTIGEFNMCLCIILGLPVWVKAVIVLCLIIILLPDDIEIWL